MAVGGFEMDFNKVVMSLMLAVLLWVGNTVYKSSIQLAVIENRLTALEINSGNTATESDIILLTQRVSRLEDWNQNLSKRLADVESTIRKEDVQ